jgi:hypothetical protein
MNQLTRMRDSSIYPRSTLLALCGCVVLLGGCATATTSTGMVPTSYQVAQTHPQTVSVDVKGGQETGSMGKPQISNVTFQQALVESITKSQTFSRVVEGTGGDYVLSVILFSVDQPSIGFDFTVKMEAGWTLKRANTGVTVWQEAIRSVYTATTDDAFAGVTRLRLATEGAARNNIAEGLSKISKLNL